jgi:hypothetical protein
MIPTSTRPAPFLVGAVILVATTLFSGCYREFSEDTASLQYPRISSPGPWEVDGVRPGQTLDEIKRLRGEPGGQIGHGPRPTFRWPAPLETTVTFDQGGRAIDIYGTTLTSGGRTWVDAGLEQRAIEHVLGKGRVEQHSRPSGSGVISVGRTVLGRSVSYENHGSVFEIHANTTQVTAVRARPRK